MGIKQDFAPYRDGNGLMAPNPTTGQRGSDNGPMFTSEYVIMLKRNNCLDSNDIEDYNDRMEACLNLDDMLCRAPGAYTEQEGPDDYYGVMNGCHEMGNTGVPRKILWSLIKHFGFLNNEELGKLDGKSFMLRQPQMVYAMMCAAFPSLWNPIHHAVRLLALPLSLVSALVLATSCVFADKSDTDARRLAWHLGNNVSQVSLLNWLAWKVWLARLGRDYPGEMKDVAAMYYQPNGLNPYSKWWVTH